MNSFNLIKINNEYVKFYVTTNSQLPKLMKNSGSLVVLHKDLGSDSINELWLGNELIASGYGFSSSELRDNLAYVGNTYNDIFDYFQNSYAYSLNYTGDVRNYIIENYATKRDNLTNAYVIYKNPGNNSSSEKIDLVDLVQSDHPVYEPYKVNFSYYSVTYSLLNCTDTVTTYTGEVILPYGASIDKVYTFISSQENDTNGVVTGSSYYMRYNNEYHNTGIQTKLTDGTDINANYTHKNTEFTTLSVQLDYTGLISDDSKLNIRNIDTGYILKDFTLYIDCSGPKDSLGNPDYTRYKKHPYLEKILGTDHPIYVYDDFYSLNKNKYVPIQNLYYKAKLPVYWKSVYINEDSSVKFKQEISIYDMLDNTVDNTLAKSDLRYSIINDDTNTVTISSTKYTTLSITNKSNDVLSNKTFIMIPAQYSIDYAYFNYEDGTRENCTGSIYRLTINKYEKKLSEVDSKVESDIYSGEIFNSKHISLPSTKSKVNTNYDFYYINRYPIDENKYYKIGDSVDIHIHLIKRDDDKNNVIDHNIEDYDTSDVLSYTGVMTDKRPVQNENYNNNFMFTYSSLGSETPNLDNLAYLLI